MKISNQKKLTITGLGILFLFSGFAGLIYEAIWTDYVKLFIGHAAYAQSFVLVLYMGGMATGAWIVSKVSKRLNNCIFWYAIAELLLGISALFFHTVFINYQEFSFTSIIPVLKTPFLINVYRLISGSMLILPQSILLGATFPLMSGGLLRKYNDNPGYTISLLYFVNSLGAAAGVLFSGFYLVEKIGLPGAILYAGKIDILIAIAAIIISYTSKTKQENHDKRVPEGSAMLLFKTEALLYMVCFLTAVSSFMYEIGWIRMLSLVLGSSNHSFELMLSAFIIGLATGGYLIRKKVDQLHNPMKVLAIIQVVMGVLAISTLAFYGHLFYLMKFIITSLSKTSQGYILFKISSHFICLIIMLPATICAGMTLPVLTQYIYKNKADDSVIGKVYSFNTLGSIVGVISSVHIVIVIAGIKGLLITGGIIDMLAGLAVLWHFYKKREMASLITLSVAAIVVSIYSIVFLKIDPVLLSSGVFRFGKIDNDREMVYFRDGKTSTVSVHEELGTYYLSNNGKVDASTGSDTLSAEPDEQTQILLAAYPLAFSPKNRRVAMIGLGSGMTASVILREDSVQSLEIIEIEPFIKDAARLMGPKVQNVFTDKRCRIIIDDAKAYFSGNGKKYNIIISEPSNPWVSGVSGLFSKEFFHVIKNYLEDDGIFVQWLHTYEMSTDLLASIFKALGEEYHDYKVFYTASDLIILASKRGIGHIPCNDLFQNKTLAADLRLIGFKETGELTLGYAGSKSSLQYLFRSFNIRENSDYFPVLDQKSEKARFLEARADALTEMGCSIISVAKILENDTFPPFQPAGNRNSMRDYSVKSLQRLDQARQVLECIRVLIYEKQSIPDTQSGTSERLMIDKIRMHAYSNIKILQAQVPEYLQKLVEMTMPYLSEDEMDTIWIFTENMLSTAQAHTRHKEFFNFLKQINHRNFTGAEELGKSILGKSSIGSSSSTRIVLTGTILSMIMVNDVEGVRAIRKRVNWNFSYDLNLRLLFQKAGVYYRSNLEDNRNSGTIRNSNTR
jgi:predicted membrane-bound spermidine synthase